MPARPFVDFLREQRRGALLDDLSDSLHSLVQGVNETGVGGELILKIKVKPAENVTGGAMVVADEVVTKRPKPRKPPSIFFVDQDANLTREDPQRALDLKGPRAVDPIEPAQSAETA